MLEPVDLFSIDAVDDVFSVDFEFGGYPGVAFDGWTVDLDDVGLDGFAIFDQVSARGANVTSATRLTGVSAEELEFRADGE